MESGETRHFGLVGGLGVGATVIYYEGLTAACAVRSLLLRMTIAHAHAPTALAYVQAGRIEGLADYLAGFVRELQAAGAVVVAVPATRRCRDTKRDHHFSEFTEEIVDPKRRPSSIGGVPQQDGRTEQWQKLGPLTIVIAAQGRLHAATCSRPALDPSGRR